LKQFLSKGREKNFITKEAEELKNREKEEKYSSAIWSEVHGFIYGEQREFVSSDKVLKQDVEV
jgi:hypothetical protein